VAAGLLIAASQMGAAVAAPLFTKKTAPRARLRWMGPMAVLTCGILLVTFLHPGLVLSMAVFALSNVFAVYQISANTAFVERLPNEKRAQAFGLANAGLVVGQGAAFAIAVRARSPGAAFSSGRRERRAGRHRRLRLACSWRRMSPGHGRHTRRHLARGAAPARAGRPAREARWPLRATRPESHEGAR